jgi:hypothetical protein
MEFWTPFDIQAAETVGVRYPCAARTHPLHHDGIVINHDIGIVFTKPFRKAFAFHFRHYKRRNFQTPAGTALAKPPSVFPTAKQPSLLAFLQYNAGATITKRVQSSDRQSHRTVMIRADVMERRLPGFAVSVNRRVTRPIMPGHGGTIFDGQEKHAMDVAFPKGDVDRPSVNPRVARTNNLGFETKLNCTIAGTLGEFAMIADGAGRTPFHAIKIDNGHHSLEGTPALPAHLGHKCSGQRIAPVTQSLCGGLHTFACFKLDIGIVAKPLGHGAV